MGAGNQKLVIHGTWIEIAPVSQGSVRWQGGGCHSGQINLIPLYVHWSGSWTSTVTGKVSTTPVAQKYSKACSG
ncbi:hypothetical protein [Adlercreutzia sp. ZJ473]|uniref:hypothetical protein n=1 Tax=Adlercreutzia sp. ZJ473 TaxID=2722822 RepID=UPI001555393E|nr:hypothetical protein [Adlercreutzia sp. ZJ473]